MEGGKVTTHLRHIVHAQYHTVEAEEYVMKKYHLSPETLQSIHWEGIESALRRLPMLRRATYVKYIHDWLPTQQLLFRQCRAPSPMCEVCRDPASSETMTHLLSCPCEAVRDIQAHLWETCCRTLVDCLNTSPLIIRSWDDHIRPLLRLPQATK